MSAQAKVPRSSLPRHLRDVAENARRAAQSAVSKSSNPSQEERIAAAILRESQKKPSHEHGSRIYVWHHLLKNHVVYSLDKTMKNNAALRQLPFNGKKTVPRALRKDHWSPLAIIHFPPGPNQIRIGLTAFRKLREYRRRHELEWGDEIMYKEQTKEEIAEGKKRERESFRERGRKICDQKANSVADLAVVLGEAVAMTAGEKEKVVYVESEPEVTHRRGDERGEYKEELVTSSSSMKQEKVGEVKAQGKEAEVEKQQEAPTQTGPIIYWKSLEDAEFASEWSELIEHGEIRSLGKDGLPRALPEEFEVEEETLDIGGEGKTEGEVQPKTEGTEPKAEGEPLTTKPKDEIPLAPIVEAPPVEETPKKEPTPASQPKSLLGRLFSSFR